MEKDFKKRIKRVTLATAMEEEFKWHERSKLIPFLSFPAGWEVKVIPPHTGAIIRFRIRRAYTKEEVSVYLDFDSMLGACDQPYWEVHPYMGDVGRCDLKDTEELIKMIEAGLDEAGGEE